MEMPSPGPAHAQLARDPERWRQELRARFTETGEARVFLEKVELRSAGEIDPEALLEREDAFGDMMRFVSALEGDSVRLDDFAARFADLAGELPRELLAEDAPDRFDPTDPDCLRALLPGVRDLLMTRLLDVEEPG